MTLNQYKIDVNRYVSGSFPFALYVKRPWHWCWEHIESFQTIEQARAAYGALGKMPIYLGVAARGL